MKNFLKLLIPLFISIGLTALTIAPSSCIEEGDIEEAPKCKLTCPEDYTLRRDSDGLCICRSNSHTAPSCPDGSSLYGNGGGANCQCRQEVEPTCPTGCKLLTPPATILCQCVKE